MNHFEHTIMLVVNYVAQL